LCKATGFAQHAHLALVAFLVHPEPAARPCAGAGFAVGCALMTVSRTSSRDPDAWDEDRPPPSGGSGGYWQSRLPWSSPHPLGWAGALVPGGA
jgi:hypothetical protein